MDAEADAQTMDRWSSDGIGQRCLHIYIYTGVETP